MLFDGKWITLGDSKSCGVYKKPMRSGKRIICWQLSCETTPRVNIQRKSTTHTPDISHVRRSVNKDTQISRVNFPHGYMVKISWKKSLLRTWTSDTIFTVLEFIQINQIFERIILLKIFPKGMPNKLRFHNKILTVSHLLFFNWQHCQSYNYEIHSKLQFICIISQSLCSLFNGFGNVPLLHILLSSPLRRLLLIDRSTANIIKINFAIHP